MKVYYIKWQDKNKDYAAFTEAENFQHAKKKILEKTGKEIPEYYSCIEMPPESNPEFVYFEER